MEISLSERIIEFFPLAVAAGIGVLIALYLWFQPGQQSQAGTPWRESSEPNTMSNTLWGPNIYTDELTDEGRPYRPIRLTPSQDKRLDKFVKITLATAATFFLFLFWFAFGGFLEDISRQSLIYHILFFTAFLFPACSYAFMVLTNLESKKIYLIISIIVMALIWLVLDSIEAEDLICIMIPITLFILLIEDD